MTIRAGQEWGWTAPAPPDAVIVDSDRALSEWSASQVVPDGTQSTPLDSSERPLNAVRTPMAPVVLTGGNLWRSLGGPSVIDRWRSADARWLPIDLMRLTLDGHSRWVVNAVVAVGRSAQLASSITVALNGAYVGGRQIGARAHPNDGLIDVLRGDLPVGELVKIVRRTRTGGHLPHPAVSVSRASTHHETFRRRHQIWADGARLGRFTELRIEIVPDAALVIL